MKYLPLFLILVIILTITGCITENPNTAPLQNSVEKITGINDPSAPASSAEKYCLDVKQMNAIEPHPPRPEATITGTIKSNCNYPVEGLMQLFAYDKNNQQIQGFNEIGVQDARQVFIKPGETQSYTMTFDMRRVPDNPRDPDPSISASFKVNAYVTRIVSAREALTWKS